MVVRASEQPTNELESVRSALRALEERIDRLEALSAALPVSPARPERTAPVATGALPAAPPTPRGESPGDRAWAAPPGEETPVAALAGRLALVLAGAFLLRTLSERGHIPGAVGPAVGLLYAWSWIVAAERAGRRGRRLAATFHGVAAAMLAYPLAWESVVRFALVSPSVAAVAMGLTFLGGMAVAVRYDLQSLAWVFGCGAAGAGAPLLLSGGGAAPFAAFFVVLGVAALVVSRVRGWVLPAWPAAAAADAAVVFLTSVAVGGRASLSTPFVLAVQLGLATLYLGTIAHGLFVRGRALSAFDGIQSAAALFVGYRGALAVAATAGGTTVLGGVGLVAGVAAYVVAFRGVDRSHRGEFFFVTTVALALVLLGSAAVFEGPSLLWAILGVAAAGAGSRLGRVTLGLHGVLYAVCAGSAAGLFPWAAAVWAGSASAPWPSPSVSAWIVLGLVGLCAAAPPIREDRYWRKFAPAPSVLFAALTLVLVGAALVSFAVPIVAGTPGHGADPALTAVVRTVVLAAAAVACALLAGAAPLRHLGLLVYAALGLGLVKLLVEDLPGGRPATLWISLLVYGTALIAGTRRSRRRPVHAEAGEPPHGRTGP